ncbi:MAG: TIR domain-containing protein, partial [Lachnospiraceae bacterium]|nr:TIR domain-containing protein [Lachnospiraceae bacterium]
MSAEMVFISYSSKNADLADALVAYLEKKGITCWYAPRNIEPGSEWVPAIKSALQTTKVFVLLYTHQSNESRQVMNEVALAFNAGKTMVPYCATDEKMNDELEYYLTRVHWLNAVNKPQVECFEELSKLIEGNLRRMNVEIHPVEAGTARNAEITQEAEIVQEAVATPETEIVQEAVATPETEIVREAVATPETEIVQEVVTEEAEIVQEATAMPEAETSRENWATSETEATSEAKVVLETETGFAEAVQEITPAAETENTPEAVPAAPKATSGYVAGQEAEAAARAIKAMREAQRKEALAKSALEDETDGKASGWDALDEKKRKIIFWGGAAAAFVVLLLLGILLGTKLAKSGEEDPESDRVETEESREIAESGETKETSASAVSADAGEAWEESVAALSAIEKRQLGYQYLNGYGVEPDIELGRQLLKQAGEEGDYEAKLAYAKDMLYGTSGGEINEAEGIRVMKQIVDGGTKDPLVMIALANYYERIKNYKEALHYYQFASDSMTDAGLFQKLAEYYLEGKGTKKDPYYAMYWINLAEDPDPNAEERYQNYAEMAYDCIYDRLDVPSNLKMDIILEAAEDG